LVVIVGAGCGGVVVDGVEVRGAATGGIDEDSAPPHAHAVTANTSATRFRIKAQLMILPERKIDRERVVKGSEG
jgi:hypothetical protein